MDCIEAFLFFNSLTISSVFIIGFGSSLPLPAPSLSPIEMLLPNKLYPYFDVFLFIYFRDPPSLIRVACVSTDEDHLLKHGQPTPL